MSFIVARTNIQAWARFMQGSGQEIGLNCMRALPYLQQAKQRKDDFMVNGATPRGSGEKEEDRKGG